MQKRAANLPQPAGPFDVIMRELPGLAASALDLSPADLVAELRRIISKAVDATIPVILLTAKVQGADQKRFASLGVAAILFKPFDPLTLAQQMSAALGWPS